MSNSEVLIECEGVGKKFCRDFRKSLAYGLRDCARDLIGGRTRAADILRPDEFWANHDINFEVSRGECLGLIGRNGAGKTTLLKMLNGLIKPDTGHIRMRGRTGAMIALGAGFNPILTGRENVYVNGSILGLSRAQIDQRLDEIVDFAEIPDAIDSPVRTYSSGMQVRLGFAVACLLLSPDILIVDEVLAVGDASFRRKCYDFFRRLRRNGSSVILVTHGLSQVSMIADKAIVLERGRVDFAGDPSAAVGHLLDLSEAGEETEGSLGFKNSSSPLSISSVEVLGHSKDNDVRTGDTLRFRVHMESQKNIERLQCSASIWLRDETTMLSSMHSSLDNFYFSARPGEEHVDLILKDCPLIPGKYFFKFTLGVPGIPTPYAELGYETSPVAFLIGHPEHGIIDPNEAINGAAVHLNVSWDARCPFNC